MVGSLRAIPAFYRASPRLTVCLIALSAAGGLLVPALMVASGALVQSVRDGTGYVPPLLAVALIFGAQRMLDPIRQYLGQILLLRIDESLGDRVMIAASAPVGLLELESPEIQDRITQARGALTGFTPGQAAEHLAYNINWKIQSLASLAIIASYSWAVTIALLLVYVVSFALTRRHYREVTLIVWNRTERLRRALYLRSLALTSRAAKETRIFGLAHWLVRGYREISFAVLDDVWRKRNEGWVAALVSTLLMAGVELGGLALLVSDAIAARITLGTAVTLTQAVLVAGLLARYEDSDYALEDSSASVGKVKELEASLTASKPSRTGSASADGLPHHSIRFDDVTFRYPGRASPVLHHLNLEIEAGRSLAIVGENGAGKTTLVKLLTRLYEPTAGRIVVDGVDLRDIEPRAWHRRVAALFQDFARFELRAYDNVAFGALHAGGDAAAVSQAAANAGVLSVVERLEHGWDTVLSREFREGAELSGGEWQRLALARALFGVASGAGVLILDEPTASLDVRGEAEVYQRFLDLTRGVTTIVISHRFSTVRRADRIIVIEHGQVLEDGTHQQLVSLPEGRYAKMYTLQAARFSDTAVDGGA